MTTPSERTIRVRGIPEDTPDDIVTNFVRQLSSGSASQFTSLAPQNGEKVATITLQTSKLKSQALKGSSEPWITDDVFDGLTVLYSSETPDVDICAVHGLDGNAFDTWMADTKMWLRDILPSSEPLTNSRIMTFGYNCKAKDRTALSGLEDWADELLSQVEFARTSVEERDRPIIFICYSLGGLVGREAIVRLHRYGKNNPSIKIERCGLLFLSTPHSGTTEADWNKFLVDIAELTFGVRSNAIVDKLRSFSPESVESQRAFTNVEPMPPFFCLCESSKTKIAGKLRTIVTQGSASLGNETAVQMTNVDHLKVCKFETKFGGYMIVLDRLQKIRGKLLIGNGPGAPNFQNIPGRPALASPRYPLPSGVKHYQGSALLSHRKLIGRSSEQEQLKKILAEVREEESGAIAVTGMGGIGKTELLLELAHEYRNVTNVFFLHVESGESLEDAYMEIATRVGHDILSTRYPEQDTHRIWRSFTSDEKMRAFIDWLEHSENREALFIVDDLDGLNDERAMRDALPRQAGNVLLSTRNPGLIGTIPRMCHHLRLSKMNQDEVAALMTALIRSRGYSIHDGPITEKDLEAVAGVVDGHPLAASQAISYIMQVLAPDSSRSPAQQFVDIMRKGTHKDRMLFLEYKPLFSLSIMETFEVSLKRLCNAEDMVLRLIQLVSLLQNDDPPINFHSFLFTHRPWLDTLRSDLPDFDIFAAGELQLKACIAKIESVSLGLRSSLTGPLQFHRLTLECIRQHMGHNSRVRFIRQIILLCYYSMSRGEHVDRVKLYVRNCLVVAGLFEIILDQLELPISIETWLKNDGKPVPPPPRRNLGPIERQTSELWKECNNMMTRIERSSDVQPTHESRARTDLEAVRLLRRLRNLEDACLTTPPPVNVINQLLAVYDILISITSHLKPENPAVWLGLGKRKEELEQRNQQR